MRSFVPIFVFPGLFILTSLGIRADSVAPKTGDNSPEAELRAFELVSGYEISLFASEKDGIANPITMRWDAKGRLWVLCSWGYPQVKPDKRPNDKILILEDTNGDGRADKTLVYLDGLNMPMGFEFGDGGVYVAEGTRLLHFRDTNSDGKADERRVVFSGFGTGDTHQNINSLTWSPGGELFFGQGNRIYSRVETDRGVVKADSGTIWRYRPRKNRLQRFMQDNMAAVNPWGVNFDRWGEMFVKSNDPPLIYAQPGMIETSHYLAMGFRVAESSSCIIQKTHAKSMIVEVIEGSHLPDDLQGDVLIAGYKSQNIERFKLKRDGAGLHGERLPPMLTSKHPSFRPVDIRVGPDGAIYIADWFNPIIGHYQADFHHPNRDKTHGRIWRITAKGRPLVKPPVLVGLPIPKLLEQLKSKERWVRLQVKKILFQEKTKPLIKALDDWIAALDPEEADYEHYLYETIGLYEAHETVRPKLLMQLLDARHPGARGYATRVVGRWHDRLKNPLSLLEKRIADEHPRVRMEAVVSAAAIDDPRAMVVAAGALDHPRDRFITYALAQAAHATKHRWQPALASGQLKFSRSAHVAFVLKTAGGKAVVPLAKRMYASPNLPEETESGLLVMITEMGNSSDLRFVLDEAMKSPSLLKAVLPVLGQASKLRGGIRPTGDLEKSIRSILSTKKNYPVIIEEAIHLTGTWKLAGFLKTLEAYARSSSTDPKVRAAAIGAMARLNLKTTKSILAKLDYGKLPAPVQGAIIETFLRSSLKDGSKIATEILATSVEEKSLSFIIRPILKRRGGGKALASALSEVPLKELSKNAILELVTSGGSSEPELVKLLTGQQADTFGTPKISKKLVSDLVAEMKKSSSAERGRVVFHSKKLGCIACHKMSGSGGMVGPELTSIGAGMPVDRILEAILWPKKEIKEGYESTSILTEDGKQLRGYVRNKDENTLWLQQHDTGKLVPIPIESIDDQRGGETAMPNDLTKLITRQQLLDLVRYLSQRKGQPASK